MLKKNTEITRQDFQLNWRGVCTRWYIQGRCRNRSQAGACRGRCRGRRRRDWSCVFSRGLGECILLTLSNSTSSIAASDPTNYAPFSLLCRVFLNKTTQLPVQNFHFNSKLKPCCEWERVSHVPLPVPSTYCASLLFTIETAWLTGKRLERVSCFIFGLLVGWTVSWGSIGLKMVL